MGTRFHQWAKDTIDLGIKQPRSKKTIYAYVNDAIGFKMSTEVVLYYSDRFSEQQILYVLEMKCLEFTI